MIIAPSQANVRPTARSIAIAPPYDESERGQLARLLEGELFDLYGAILIVVPVAFFLKSLWF